MSNLMSKEVVTVYNDKVLNHKPTFDIYNGIQNPSLDTPDRAKAIIGALTALNATTDVEIIQPREFGLPFIYRVHDQAYVDHLKKTSERVGQKPPVLLAEIDPESKLPILKEYPAFTYPSVFPHGSNPRSSNRVSDRGLHSFDTSTPVMGDTYELALNAAFTSLTGAEMLAKGNDLVYAFCRPPGHHAEKSMMGGYCYLNNASIAARYLTDQTHKRVGIIDIDAHHGNGTQEIFYGSPDVFYASIHGNPSQIPPYYTGYADEKGEGAGFGYNLNIPLPIGSNDEAFLKALDMTIFQMKLFLPQYLIISLGFDGFKDDPLKIFKLTTEGYAEAARLIGALGLPTLSVQEGGYATADLELNIATYLKSLKNSHL